MMENITDEQFEQLKDWILYRKNQYWELQSKYEALTGRYYRPSGPRDLPKEVNDGTS